MPDPTVFDGEIQACAAAYAALSPLDTDQRERVLAYLFDRLLPGAKISADVGRKVSWSALSVAVADALGEIQSKDEALEELAARLEQAEARLEEGP